MTQPRNPKPDYEPTIIDLLAQAPNDGDGAYALDPLGKSCEILLDPKLEASDDSNSLSQS